MTDFVVPYRTLVEKAFIEPIRSVVVVDDDFPTLDKLLAAAVQSREAASAGAVDALTKTASTEGPVAIDGNSGGAPSSIQFSFNGSEREVRRAADLIAACRSRTPPWIVDIHDGSPNDGVDELDLAPTLHHSDLMILDYHLNGDAGDGQRAIDILRALAKNGQFNLVVVFTKGIQGSLELVFEQIWTGLLSKKDDGRISAEKLLALQEFVTKWEDESGDEISASLLERTSTKAYLRQRSGEDVFVSDSLNAVFKPLLEKCPESVFAAGICFSVDGTEQTSQVTPKDLFEYGLSARREKLLSSHSHIDLGNIKWKYSADANWLRLDQLFLTVVNKGDTTPSDLIDRLTAALVDWEPGPHHLLMTKMRNQLSEYGVVQEAEVLADHALQSGWLHQMLGTEDAKVVMAQSVNRHWDALGDGILDRVSQYGHDLVGHFRSRDKNSVFARHSRPEFDEKKRLAHLNHYYSNKPVESTNLTTGHIIQIENAVNGDASSIEYWICLSPACDLVPGQVKPNSWRSRLGEAIPFIGVQLKKEGIADALKNINHNRHVFIKDDDGNIASYAFSGSQTVSTPVWEQMFALDSGAISVGDGGIMSVSVQRMSFSPAPVLASDAQVELESGSNISEVSTGLKFVNFRARVVSQLRYEYALNLLQRLGSSFSRVGLDFQGF
jgi:CheY-like chemotaxis protein